MPSFIHLLKIRVRNGAKIDSNNLINLVCISPHCIALLSERSSIRRETSSSEVSCICKDGQQGLEYCGLSERPEIFLPTWTLFHKNMHYIHWQFR